VRGAGTVCRYTFEPRLAGSSPNSEHGRARSTPGSILRTILNVFEGPVTITARNLFLGVRRERLQVLSGRIVCRLSMWTRCWNFGWRHKQQNLLLALWLCRQDREYEVRKQ
jgi:hypothetical protein